MPPWQKAPRRKPLPPSSPSGPPPDIENGGPALRTRASTRSPAKIARPAAPPRIARKAIRKPKPLPKPKHIPNPVQEPPQQSAQDAPSSPQRPVQEAPSSPQRPAKRSFVVPHNLIGYSQARSNEELVEEDEPGPIINGAFGLPARELDELDQDDVSPDRDVEPTTPYQPRQSGCRITEEDFEMSSDSESDDQEETRSYDDNEAMTRLALPMIDVEEGIDFEFFQNDDGDSYLNISPPKRRSTIAPTSPLVARSARMNKKSTQRPKPLPITPEVEAAAIVTTGEDVLEQHQAKRRRIAPTLGKLAAAAERLDQAARAKQVAPSRHPAPPGRIVAAHQNPVVPLPLPTQRITNPRTTVTGPTRAVRVVAPAAPVDLATAARQPDPPVDEDESFGDTTGASRKRKRSSNPAPHHLHSKTPNTRIVLRRGKDEYGFRILVNNAYPDTHQRVVEARAAHDVALVTMPDAAAAATGVSWSPSKLRLYGDTAWVRRSAIKTAASAMVSQSYRLFVPPALAERIPGGADPVNTKTYVKNRILYLMERGRWLRGNHGGHTSMLYAHPTFAMVLEQAVYRPASAGQRAFLCPMPLPAIALVATAILCALEEWSTGVRIKISFTEETYARIYRNHLTRLQRMSQSHEGLVGTLQEQLYEYCVSRNEAQPVAQPQLEDDLDDLDVLDSEMEEADAAEQPAEFGDFDDFDE